MPGVVCTGYRAGSCETFRRVRADNRNKQSTGRWESRKDKWRDPNWRAHASGSVFVKCGLHGGAEDNSRLPKDGALSARCRGSVQAPRSLSAAEARLARTGPRQNTARILVWSSWSTGNPNSETPVVESPLEELAGPRPPREKPGVPVSGGRRRIHWRLFHKAHDAQHPTGMAAMCGGCPCYARPDPS